jgi:hypothetical protein
MLSTFDTTRLSLTCKHVHDHLHAVSDSNVKRITTASDYDGIVIAVSELCDFCDDKALAGTLDRYVFSMFIMPSVYTIYGEHIKSGRILLLDALEYRKKYLGIELTPGKTSTDVEGSWSYSVIFYKCYVTKYFRALDFDPFDPDLSQDPTKDPEVCIVQAWDSASSREHNDPHSHTPRYVKMTIICSDTVYNEAQSNPSIVVKYTLRQ